MKAFVLAMAAIVSGNAFSATITPVNSYSEYSVRLESTEKVNLLVKGQPYRASRPATRIQLKRVAPDLYVVTQNYLYYTMQVDHRPVRTLQDQTSVVLDAQQSSFVRVLVPNNLTISQARVIAPGTMTCMAYWQGFVYDSETDSCSQVGTSGCSNPFEFQTHDACEVGNLLR